MTLLTSVCNSKMSSKEQPDQVAISCGTVSIPGRPATKSTPHSMAKDGRTHAAQGMQTPR